MKQQLNKFASSRSIAVLLIAIVLIGSFLRFYKLSQLMPFFADLGWFYWSAKQMIVNHNFPLVGITSSHVWIHQGALWTYILGVILSIFKFNPLAPAYFIAFCGVITVFLVYFVAKEMFSEKVGLISAFLYATSPLVIQNSRLAYHTSLIPMVVFLFIYSVFRFVKGDKRFFPILILLSAVLYNFELSTISLIGVFALIMLFGFIKKKKYIKGLRSRKNIVYSLLAFMVPMVPMIFYDFSHGFPQTLKFGAWIIYRILQVFRIPGIPRSYEGQGLKEFIIYCQNVVREFIFIKNAEVALIIFFLSLILFLALIFKRFRKKQLKIPESILFLFVSIPTLGFLFQKTTSDAYLPMLFPQWIILIGFVFDYLAKKAFKKYLITLLIVLVGLIDGYTLIANNYFVKNNINTYFAAINKIIHDSNGKSFNIIGKGQGSQYESFVTPYEYIAWYLGKPASEKSEKLKYYVSEYPAKIVVERK